MNRRGKTKEGFLHVKQPSRFGKAWKRKWVVIRPNATKGTEQTSILLELYLEKGAVNKTVTSLLLEGITQIKRVISKSQPRAFDFIKGAGIVALTLAGDSETETQEWIEIFKKLLLPPSEQKELTSIPGFGTDVYRLSVVPNKDSERLKLSGNYLATVSRLQVTLHNIITGDKVIDWDLRHMKRFMLPSKGPQQDMEKIACLQMSNRSPQGEGEYLFHSPNAKPLVESIYERLSSAITVKERRSRTSSMLFEIPPKELEQLAKAIQDGGDPGFVMVSTDGSIEDEAFDEEEEKKENGETKTNGDAVDAKTNGEEGKNHVEAVTDGGKIQNGQSEAEKPNAEETITEPSSEEKPAAVEATEAKEATSGDALPGNGDKSIEGETIEKTPDAAVEDAAKVEVDAGVAVSQESEDNVKETAQSEKPVDEQNGNEEEVKDTEVEQPPESSEGIVDGVDESANTQTVEKQDFTAGPIDAEEEGDEVEEASAEPQPRMPPKSEDYEQASEEAEAKDASEQIDERTVETTENVVLNGEEVVALGEGKTCVEDNNQVEISTDTQDIAAESSVEKQIAHDEKSTEPSEDVQEQKPTEEPGEDSSADSTKEANEASEKAGSMAQSIPSDPAEPTSVVEQSPAVASEAEDENKNVPDERSSTSSPSEQVEMSEDKTLASDEATQNEQAGSPPAESVEAPITDDGNYTQEKEETSNSSTVSSDNKRELVNETVEAPIFEEKVKIQEQRDDLIDKNAEEEDTAM